MSGAPTPSLVEERRAGAAENRLGRRLFAATVLGLAVFAALSFYGDVRELGLSLRGFHWSSFVVGLALATANYVLRFGRWQYYLARVDVHPPLADSARVFVAGFVMSITPGKVGEVWKSVLLHECQGIPVERTAPIVFAERLTDLFALVILAALGSLVFEEGAKIAFAGGLAVFALWAVCAFRPVGELCLRLCERLPLLRRITPRLRDAYESLRSLLGPGALLAATAIATLSWLLECVTLMVIARGFGVDLGLIESTFAYSAPTIVGALAMMPGGLGVTEAGMTGVLTAIGGTGMSPAVATGITMLVRIATLWWAVLLGFVALALHRRALASRA
jgi:glycosyltransferase 2 family protein